MKKLLLLSMVLFISANLFARTPEQMQASKDRLAKLEKLGEAPKTCGMAGEETAFMTQVIADMVKALSK